jgi:TolB-like protein/Flp pilus assembly protein TadD
MDTQKTLINAGRICQYDVKAGSGTEVAEGDGEGQATGAHTGTPDVFISYASPDSTVAATVCEALEHAGVICWIAPRDVTPGTFYADEIVHAIDAAKAIVLVLSHNAATSPHVLREVERATSKRHPVVSLRIDQAPLPAGLEYFLNTSQWLDASGGNTAPAMPKLVAAVRVAIHAPAVTAVTTKILPTVKTRLSTRSPNRTVIVVTSVVGLAIVGIAANRLWLLSNPAASTSGPIAATPTPTTAAAPVAVASVTPAAFSPPEHSVAVLPFTNMSGDPKQDYFSDGLSEELLNALASIRGLQVAARTSSFSFKDKGMDVASIARRLNVGAVLEGSVRKDGGQIRITAQLINAVTGFHMWSHTYDRDLKNVLALQTEIANAATKELESTLLVDASTAVELGGTRNPLAFDAYLKARGINVVSKETNLAEIAAYDEAIRLDSRYAKAYAGKAVSLSRFSGSYEPAATARKVVEQALAIAEKAVQLAPDLAEAHLVLAEIYDAGLLEFRHGLTEYERAQALAPGDNRVIRNYAEFLARMGHADSAVANAQRAVTMDPVNADSHDRLGWVYYFSHRYQEAVAAFDHALSLEPNHPWTNAVRGLSYLGLGNIEAARSSCKTPPLFWPNQMCIAIVSDKLRDKAAAQSMLAQLKSALGEAAAYQYASVYAQNGEIPNALNWLETAYRLKDPGLAWLKVDFLLDPLRGEPRFQEIERKLKFPN